MPACVERLTDQEVRDRVRLAVDQHWRENLKGALLVDILEERRREADSSAIMLGGVMWTAALVMCLVAVFVWAC